MPRAAHPVNQPSKRMMLMRVLVLLCLLGAMHPDHRASACTFVPWFTYQSTRLFRSPEADAYLYVTDRVAIDADGAPNAYHPKDTGIDALANAGYPHGGWRSVLVADPVDSSRPYVQREGQYEGYYVSKTTLTDQSKPITATTRYVDATRTPYLVFPGAFLQRAGTGFMGDLAFARHISSERTSSAIVADTGPRTARLGEISIALAETLSGESVNARNGGGAPRGDVIYVVFRGSGATPPWPLTDEEREQFANERLASLGGWQAILDCAATARMQ